MMNALRLLSTVVIAVAAASCNDAASAPTPPVPPGAVTFVFRLHRHPSTEEFRVADSSAEFIAMARAQLRLPEAQRLLFAAGTIRAGDGGHNTGWSWHYTSVSLVEAAIELCDGTPSLVEADLDYWLNTVRTFCPWSSYVFAEVR